MSLSCDGMWGRCACPDLELGKLADQARLLQLLFGSLSLPKSNCICIQSVWLGRKRESVTQRAISKLCPHEPHPLLHYQMCFYMGKYRSVHCTFQMFEIQRCPLFGSRKCTLSTGIAVGMYIHGGPLFGGGPLLGGSVIGGSTVFSKLLFLSCTRGVYISHLAISSKL